MYQDNIQKLLNEQERTIISIYQNTLVGPLMSKLGLISAQILLNYRQYEYAYRLLILPDKNRIRSVFPITLRLGNKNA